MANEVVHFEITGPDGEALRHFYGDLFGWSFRDAEGRDYGLVAPEDREAGIGGGVGATTTGGPLTTVYVAVDDPQGYLDRAVAMGATVVLPLETVPGGITSGLFRDPQGNVVGVVGT